MGDSPRTEGVKKSRIGVVEIKFLYTFKANK
jgi:hypothetical protein